MNRNAEHIIGKQVVEAMFSKGSNRLVLQQRLAWLVEEALPKHLTRVFDRIAGPEQWVEIDTLEIDLGHLSVTDTDKNWVEQAVKAYEKAVQFQLQSQTKTITADTGQLKLIQYWLLHGYLPWWGEVSSFKECITSVAQQQPKAILKLLEDKMIRKRWVHYVDNDQQQMLVKSLKLSLPVGITAWLDVFSDIERAGARYWYWESIWRQYLKYHILPTRVFNEQLDRHLIRIQYHLLLNTNEKPDEKLFSWKITNVNEYKEKNLEKNLHKNGYKYDDFSGDGIDEEGISVSPYEQDTFSKEKLDEKNQNAAKQKSTALVSNHSEGIFVPLAGIVLIHPFIEAFFGQLGLLEGAHFKDVTAQTRAVFLLFYLVTGRVQVEEPALPLLKLLCGFSPETLIEPLSVPLLPKELEEAERMLQAAIDHWPAIEGTTVEELQTTFMIRDGKLSKTAMGWQLIVEQQSFDLVFQYLPWGLSPIQFPWMDQMLWVDWA